MWAVEGMVLGAGRRGLAWMVWGGRDLMDKPIGRGLGSKKRGGKDLSLGLHGGLVWVLSRSIHCSKGWLGRREWKGMGVGLEAEEDDGVEEGRGVEDEARWGVEEESLGVVCGVEDAREWKKALACCVARYGVWCGGERDLGRGVWGRKAVGSALP